MDTYEQQHNRTTTINTALTRYFYGNLVAGICLYLGTASIVCYWTTQQTETSTSTTNYTTTNPSSGGMDRRASDIVTGLSRLFTGVLGLVLSVKLCQWIGVYKSVRIDHWGQDTTNFHGYYYHYTSLPKLKIDFSLALWYRLMSTFCFHLYFSCSNANNYINNIALGIVGGGIPLGVLLLVMVRLVRTHPLLKPRKRGIATVLALVLSVASTVCVGFGVYYIEMVWKESENNNNTMLYVYADDNDNDDSSWDNGSTVKTSSADNGKMAAAVAALVPRVTLIVSGIWGIVVCGGVHAIAKYVSRATSSSTTSSNRMEQQQQPTTTHADSSSLSEITKPLPQSSSKVAAPSLLQYTSDHFRDGAPGIDMKKAKKQIRKLLRSTTTTTPPTTTTGIARDFTGADENDDNHNDNDDNYKSFTRGEKGDDPPPENTKEAKCLVPLPYISYCTLIKSQLYERYSRRSKPSVYSSSSSFLWRFGRVTQDIVWCVTSLLFLYMTLVNIGATHQQNIVRLSLNDAFELLYPPDYHTGKMCAWSEKSPDGHIRTFDTLQEVYDTDRNYTVIHCGECGACSNWNDLSLQWTTRTFLAKVSKKCARKSILGSIESVQECNEKLIGFTPKCAECWTVDEVCARDNCFWIFLQATMINAMTDFRVGLNDITTATCDEAICGPHFGPCVGAIRRRMNIKSDIERPISQQCLPVQEDWSAIFD
uniref:Transmembrane protein n=1 Tax=Pseudo-nitzschia australis TaxID=44445 RepID=A0A7S4AHW5_9STRA